MNTEMPHYPADMEFAEVQISQLKAMQEKGFVVQKVMQSTNELGVCVVYVIGRPKTPAASAQTPAANAQPSKPTDTDEKHEIAAAIAGIKWTQTAGRRWAFVFNSKTGETMDADAETLKKAIEKAGGKLVFEGKTYTVDKRFFNEK